MNHGQQQVLRYLRSKPKTMESLCTKVRAAVNRVAPALQNPRLMGGSLTIAIYRYSTRHTGLQVLRMNSTSTGRLWGTFRATPRDPTTQPQQPRFDIDHRSKERHAAGPDRSAGNESNYKQRRTKALLSCHASSLPGAAGYGRI